MNVEKFLSNFYVGTKNPSLSGIRYLMEKFNNPQDKVKSIHIAGTNGKGSVTEMITNVLIKEGYKVAKFISPHLIHYNERISVNNKNITDEDMEELINRIIPVIDKYNVENSIPITLFELETAMAFIYFKEQRCDFAVVETGLGGLFDCTNIIKCPLVSVITSIGYDHMRILGNTLPEIASQKAGIIKPNSNTIIFSQELEVDDVFINQCKKMNNNLYIVKKSDITNYSFDKDFQYFDYGGKENLSINLKGKVQVKNACLCIETVKILNQLNYYVTDLSLRDGLKTVVHKGRMEQLNEEPLIIFDGAHNEPAINNLQEMVNMYFQDKKRVYIISILKRKDYDKMLKKISYDKEAEFILTSGNDPNIYALNTELYEVMNKYVDKDRIYIKELKDAIEEVMYDNLDKVYFVIGSFYTYGTVVDSIQLLKNKKNE